MNERLLQRLGGSLRRSPYVWLVATILFLLNLNFALVPIAKKPGSGNVWLAIGAVTLAVYSVGLWFWFPRHLTRGATVTHLDDRIATLAWTFALAPYLVVPSQDVGDGLLT